MMEIDNRKKQLEELLQNGELVRVCDSVTCLKLFFVIFDL